MKYADVQRMRKQAGWWKDLKDKASSAFESWKGDPKDAGDTSSARYNPEAVSALANSELGKKYLDRMSGAEWGWTGVGGLLGGGAGYLLSKLIHRKASLANRLAYTLGGIAAGAGGANVIMRNVRSSAYGNKTISEALRLKVAENQLSPQDQITYHEWRDKRVEPVNKARWIADAVGGAVGGITGYRGTGPAARTAAERARGQTEIRQKAINEALTGSIGKDVATLNAAMANDGLTVDQVRDPNTVKGVKKKQKAQALHAQLEMIERNLGQTLGAKGSQTLSTTTTNGSSRFTADTHMVEPVKAGQTAYDIEYARKTSKKRKAGRTAAGAVFGVGAAEGARAYLNWYDKQLRPGEDPDFKPASREEREQREQLVRNMNGK